MKNFSLFYLKISMARKVTYLLIALGLPGLVFVFLKFFGRNEFNIPVFHQESTVEAPVGCFVKLQTPYQVPDTIMHKLGVRSKERATVISYENNHEGERNIEKVKREIGSDVALIFPNRTMASEDSVFTKIKNCFLLLNEPYTTVLIDNDRRIRGYYAPSSLEESDRLVLELKILLKKY